MFEGVEGLRGGELEGGKEDNFVSGREAVFTLSLLIGQHAVVLINCHHRSALWGRGLGGVNLPTGAAEKDTGRGRIGELLPTHSTLSDGDIPSLQFRHFAMKSGCSGTTIPEIQCNLDP